MNRPPRMARVLLAWLAPDEHRQALLDDLEEEFVRRWRQENGHAVYWYWTQALAGVPALLRLRLRGRSWPVVAPGFMRGLVLDVRHAVRMLRGAPGFTAVAVLSLALGIGATTALYGAIRVAVLDELAVDRPEELRLFYWSLPPNNQIRQYNSGTYRHEATGKVHRTNVSYPALSALIARNPDHLFGFNFRPGLAVNADSISATTVGGLLVSGNTFRVLRPQVALGRGLVPDDDRLGAAPVAVLGHRFWSTVLGGNPRIIGRIVKLNGAPFTVVGVMSASFPGLSTGGRLTPVADVILPVSAQPAVWPGPSFTAPQVLWLRVMARVPASQEAAQAAALTATLKQSLLETGLVTETTVNDVEVVLRRGARGVDPIRAAAERPLRILATVVGIVLLIACVNLAALMLARGVSRQREMAVRQAIGAGRGRLLRQLLVENLVLSALGGFAGLWIAVVSRPLVASMLSTGFGAQASGLEMDWRTFAVAGAATGLSALLFGLLPAVRLTSGGLGGRLRQHMIGASSPRLFVGRALLVVQIAASVPLIVGAALLLRTLHNLDSVDPGFNARGLVMFRVDHVQPASMSGEPLAVDPSEIKRFLGRLVDRLEAVPGVRSATLIENPLLSGFVSNDRATIHGVEVPLHLNGIGPGFFEVFEMPLLAGRGPTLADDANAPRVAVINETAARRYFGASLPIGQRFTLQGKEIEVIGVAADSKYSGVRSEIVPTMFDPYLQRSAGRDVNVVVRAEAAGPVLEAQLRGAVAEVAPDAPVSAMRTQAEQSAMLAGSERLLARLLSLFAAFSLALACVGLYGATSYAVARRTREIGVRVALGARRDQVLWMILRSVLVLAGVGLAIGVTAALLAGSLVASFLFELQPHDPLTIVAAASLMLIVSIASGAVPAARAARLEPLIALRRD